MAKQQKQLSEADRSAARKLDIAFIIIGLAIFFGLGALFLRGVAGHLAYLTADDKIEVPAKLVSYEVSNSNSKTVKNANGIDEETHDTTYDLTYEYSIGDQVFTYVRENEPTYNEDDITLRLYRSGCSGRRRHSAARSYAPYGHCKRGICTATVSLSS